MGIFMDRSTLPSADPSTVWLADLIEATEVVTASAEPCDPAIVKAFSHRLHMRADVTPLSEPDRRAPMDEAALFARPYFRGSPLGQMWASRRWIAIPFTSGFPWSG